MHSSLPEALPSRVAITGPLRPGFDEILSEEALAFLTDLSHTFRGRMRELLAMRARRRADWAGGRRLDFLPETAAIRAGSWKIAPPPADLERRAVEIRCPVDRAAIVDAARSGADLFVADFEDATAPSWDNMVRGQLDLRDAVHGDLRAAGSGGEKPRRLGRNGATLMVRPRGLHQIERHLLVDGEPIPAALFDFGLYLFHNAARLRAGGSGPYVDLVQLETHHEARLWNDVFLHMQQWLGLPRGTIRAAVTVQTLPAAFEMDEILFELRRHSAGLHCDLLHYAFNFVKTRRWERGALLPDVEQLTPDQTFLRACAQLAIRTGHRRWAHVLGAPSDQLPAAADDPAQTRLLDHLRAATVQQWREGHDGTVVAHADLVPPVRELFDARMPAKAQFHRFRDDVRAETAELLETPRGMRTLEGLHRAVEAGIEVLAARLEGRGSLALHGRMADAATAELSRTLVWQWVRHEASLDDGTPVTAQLVRKIADEHVRSAAAPPPATPVSPDNRVRGCELFLGCCLSPRLEEFLTAPASPEPTDSTALR